MTDGGQQWRDYRAKRMISASNIGVIAVIKPPDSSPVKIYPSFDSA
jgi:hypothetical protein